MASHVYLLVVLVITGCYTVSPITSSTITTESSLSDQTQIGNGTSFCYICLVLMEKLDFYIQQNTSTDVLNRTLYKICNLTAGNMREQCFQSIPRVIQELQSGFDPQIACMKLTLCSGSQSEQHEIKSVDSSSQRAKRSSAMNHSKECKAGLCNIVDCTLCLKILGLIDKDLYKDECQAAMSYQIPVWWKDVFQNIITPDKICALLKLCP
ncbi:hypothetical protein Btru_021749 [Bulinus truncatus]|nr:hypothetical protein Btru_021749 [Bulinus truncatus]